MRPRDGLLPAFLLALWAAPAFAQSSATLKGMDLYRSETVTLDKIDKACSPLIESYVRLRNDGRKSAVQAAEKLKAQIDEELRKLGDLAFARMNFGEYMSSGEHAAYITFDLVDAKDAKTRMPFRPVPSGHPKDPEDLVAAWQQYSELGLSLAREGTIPATEHPSCPAYHCLWGSPTPELEALERRFIEGAVSNKKALIEVLNREADPRKRAGALYVLAYLREAKELTDLLFKALEDPSEEARAAALQIFSDIALYHKTVFIEIQKIIPVLDFPATSDRSGALGLLVALADNPTYRPYVMTRATPYLPPLLKMQQPNVHDLAFTLLSLLSQETYDRRDYQAWEDWVLRQKPAGAAAPEAPRKDGR